MQYKDKRIIMDKFMNHKFAVSDIKTCSSCVKDPTLTPIHFLRTVHGLSLHLTGESILHLKNGKIIHVKPGNITYLPKGLDYTVIKLSSSEIYNIDFELFGDASLNPFSVPVKNISKLSELYKNSAQLWGKHLPDVRIKCIANLYNILYILVSQYRSTYINSKQNNLLTPAITYIHSSYLTDSFKVSHLAELCDISEVYFRRLFVKATGTSPIKYINNMKLAKAYELLQSGHYSVSETVDMTNFQDNSYFSREFKKAYGVSPSKLSRNMYDV